MRMDYYNTAEREIIAALISAGGEIRGNELYVHLELARRFVEMANERNLAIIGVEGFRRIDKFIQPDSALIIDIDSLGGQYWKTRSWDLYRRYCNVCAGLFLDAAPTEDNIVYNFVTTSCEECHGL